MTTEAAKRLLQQERLHDWNCQYAQDLPCNCVAATDVAAIEAEAVAAALEAHHRGLTLAGNGAAKCPTCGAPVVIEATEHQEFTIVGEERWTEKRYTYVDTTTIGGKPESLPVPFCRECDGTGWVEGGEAIQTVCDHCHGSCYEPASST